MSRDERPDRPAPSVVTTNGVEACRRPRPSEVTVNLVSFHSPTRDDSRGGSITGGPVETHSGRERLSQSRASPPRRNVPFSRRVLALSGGPSHRTAATRTGRVWVLLERNPPKAAVWENEADQKKFFNVTFARTYMDEARNFHDTDSYGRDDLPLVAKLADQAHTFIFERLAELKSEQSE